MRHLSRGSHMDADRAGAWLPFVLALSLLSITGLALMPMKDGAHITQTESGDDVPRFVEHFTDIEDDPVPDDELIRLAWHPLSDELGILGSEKRAEDLGNSSVFNHPVTDAKALLGLTLRWSDDETLNTTIEIKITSEIENGILRMILVEDGVEIEGRIPDQNAVVRQYETFYLPSPSSDRNLTIHQEFTLLDPGGYHLVLLLSDFYTEENFALLSTSVPARETGPAEVDAKASALIGLGLLLLCLAAVVRAEWKREITLPRLSGSLDLEGKAMAILRAGTGGVHLKEVKVELPWRLARAIRDVDLAAGSERTFEVRVKLEPDAQSVPIVTAWSIEVEEMGGWVLDLTFDSKRST